MIHLGFMKQYVEAPITKKHRKNHGELEQYFVEDTHGPIIGMDAFRFVRDKIARRKELGPLANKALHTSFLTGRMRTRKNRSVGSSTYGEKYTTWRCGSRKKAGSLCDMKEIPDSLLRVCF